MEAGFAVEEQGDRIVETTRLQSKAGKQARLEGAAGNMHSSAPPPTATSPH
jgi:hypothetical protein